MDGDGSDLGIALRKVKADGTLEGLRVATQGREFSQQDPDLLWTGSELVAAWVDYSNAASAPDLRYRVFDGSLSAKTQDVALADSALPEAGVALARFGSGWAAAYREGLEDGSENVVVKVGNDSFRVGPVQGGPIDDRPSLVELDATHLLVVFTAGTDPAATGVSNVPRLRYAVIDTASTVAPALASLDPLDDIYSSDDKSSQSRPSAGKGGDGGVYVAWHSKARAGDLAGDQAWIKRITWDPQRETKLAVNDIETLIPRTSEGSVGDQRSPALAPVALPPSGAVAIAWDDYAQSQGVGQPDVALHYAPLHSRPADGALKLVERWSGTTGAAWPAQWTHVITTYTTNPVTIASNQGQVAWPTGGGTAISYVNSHTALDVDMVTKLRFNLNSNRAGFVARLIESVPPGNPDYIAARIAANTNDTWKFFARINGADVPIFDGPSYTTASPVPTWMQGVGFKVRFRIQTNTSDSSVFIGLKLWLQDLPEPTGWTMEKTITATTHAQVITRFGTTPGRFGLFANPASTNRIVTFDDFEATFFEGSLHGDLAQPATFAPLSRASALYRPCTPDQPCAVGEVGCTQHADCANNNCQPAQSVAGGLGSNLMACTANHCSDRLLNGDEQRADCGGADCPACTCAWSTPPAGTAYCSTTCLCGVGEGSCANDGQCLPGLVCKPSALKYDLSGPTYNVCQPFHCLNRVQDTAFTEPGRAAETGPDCGGECGSCACNPTNGGALHCRVNCPCPRGHGGCAFDDECATGTICGGTIQASRYNLPAGTRVCVVPHCNDNLKNFDEVAKDCGGMDCGTCP
jgi:hypothetical protein